MGSELRDDGVAGRDNGENGKFSERERERDEDFGQRWISYIILNYC